MLFAIGLTVMNGDEAGLDALDAIAVRVEDDVHEAVLADADLLPATRWYQTSRPDRRKLFEGIAGASLHRSPRVKGPHLRRVEVHDSASAAVGRSLATASLLVLAENEFSDGALVKAATRPTGHH